LRWITAHENTALSCLLSYLHLKERKYQGPGESDKDLMRGFIICWPRSLSNIIWREDIKNCVEQTSTLAKHLGKPWSVSVNCNMFYEQNMWLLVHGDHDQHLLQAVVDKHLYRKVKKNFGSPFVLRS
jgi:hypothetical protein